MPGKSEVGAGSRRPGGGVRKPDETRWLEVCRRIVDAQRELFAGLPGIADRTVYEGIGEGGDMALAIDRRSEDIVFAELEALHAEGHALTAISEERGEVGLGAGEPRSRVVIDPIDGSLNARRTIPSHCVSIAVASGDSMADVEFAYVYDFGASEEFAAVRGGGARLNDAPLRAEGPGHGVEVVGLESAEPGAILPVVDRLRGNAFRVRSVGAIAITLSYVAAGRFDGMLTAWRCRSVDAAAGQLIAREAGAVVEFEGLELGGTSLGLDARYRVAAGLDADALEVVRAAQGPEPGR
jgi:myo-inositol-1(or 4)-monophosphatase